MRSRRRASAPPDSAPTAGAGPIRPALDLRTIPTPCALRLDPKVHETGFTPGELRKRLARALLQLHDPDEAEADLRAVLILGPDREAQWLLSRAALQRGDRATALAAWQSGRVLARSCSPSPPRTPVPRTAPSATARFTATSSTAATPEPSTTPTKSPR